MPRPKGSKNVNNTQKSPTVRVTVQDHDLGGTINNNIDPEIQEVIDQGVTVVEEQALESSTINSEPEGLLSPSEETEIAQNESEEVLEGVADIPSGKFQVSGGTLPETVEKILSYAYRGAEFGSKWPMIKKWPFLTELQASKELSPEAPVFNSEEDYYTIIVRHCNPVDFVKSLIELGKVGAVIDRRDIGLLAKGVYQFKLFSPVPLNSSVYGLTAKPREPIVYSKERLEGFNDKQLDAIKTYLELSETKREDIILAILEAQDK